VLSVVVAFSGAFLTPLAAIADTTSGSANSTPVRYQAYLSPLANGGVVANTALSTGGVPTGGDELVRLDSEGAVDWTMPYQDNDIIRPAPSWDASGDVYYVRTPADLSPAELVASRGSTVRWSKLFDRGANAQPAVGASGQLYVLAGNTLMAFGVGDGDNLGHGSSFDFQ